MEDELVEMALWLIECGYSYIHTYFSWREQIGWVSYNFPSNSFVLRYQIIGGHHLWCDRRTNRKNFSCDYMCTHPSYLPVFMIFGKRINHILCNCCIHIIVKAGTLHQSGRNICHCCVIEWWSKMSVTVKCLKMFLSSQRLIRRNPHLAFYFNWNPIFVISTNLLMVR